MSAEGAPEKRLSSMICPPFWSVIWRAICSLNACPCRLAELEKNAPNFFAFRTKFLCAFGTRTRLASSLRLDIVSMQGVCKALPFALLISLSSLLKKPAVVSVCAR